MVACKATVSPTAALIAAGWIANAVVFGSEGLVEVDPQPVIKITSIKKTHVLNSAWGVRNAYHLYFFGFCLGRGERAADTDLPKHTECE